MRPNPLFIFCEFIFTPCYPDFESSLPSGQIWTLSFLLPADDHLLLLCSSLQWQVFEEENRAAVRLLAGDNVEISRSLDPCSFNKFIPVDNFLHSRSEIPALLRRGRIHKHSENQRAPNVPQKFIARSPGLVVIGKLLRAEMHYSVQSVKPTEELLCVVLANVRGLQGIRKTDGEISFFFPVKCIAI